MLKLNYGLLDMNLKMYIKMYKKERDEEDTKIITH